MQKIGYSLDKIIENSSDLKQVLKDDLRSGDLIVAATRNSVYYIKVIDNGNYRVSGGWFEKRCLSPMILTIPGCTWGGKIIKKDIVAACGMCIEFGNRIVTTPIQKVYKLPLEVQN
ncbi:MAG: hypothetical protein KAW12_27955 [Candidatus Aminicenantes bacterium]|nr:hypothetical protein [Candidatus Aminicenantes bacterium]